MNVYLCSFHELLWLGPEGIELKALFYRLITELSTESVGKLQFHFMNG